MADFVHVERIALDDPLVKPKLEEDKLAKTDVEFLESHPFVKQSVLDKIYGCIIGSALGDTIGLYTEFLPKHAAETVYKDRKFSLVDPVTQWHSDNHRNRFEPCAWTDDTDQALLIVLGYLHQGSSPDTLAALPQDFASRLKLWIEQGLLALGRPPWGIGRLVGSVVSNKTYLNDPAKCATEKWIQSGRHAAPNGSLMRTHPIGIICVGLREEEAWKLAAEVGRTTHVDPRCVVACCISVGLVRGMLRGEILNESDMDNAIERAYQWVHDQRELMNPGGDTEITEWEIKRHLDRKEFEHHVYAKSMDALKLDSAMEMGYVYKCLGSAILTLRLGMQEKEKSQVPPKVLFEDLMTDLIMEGGDSDTNGAAAGALLGTWLGYSNLPNQWVNGLAHKDWLMSKIDRLTKFVGITEGAVPEIKDEAPDGGKGLMSREQLEKRDADVLHMMLLKDKQRKEKEERERKKTRGKGLSAWFM